MQNASKIIAGMALLVAVPAAITSMQFGTEAQRQQAPQYMASTVLASLGITSAPDHNVHGASCGCAACQSCQVIDPTTI